MSNGIVAFTSRVVGVSRDARASRRRRARAMKYHSIDNRPARRRARDALGRGSKRVRERVRRHLSERLVFRLFVGDVDVRRILLEALDWSAVDYAKDFGADWWTSARKESVGRVIESAVKDSLRERDTEVVTPALVVESLLSRGRCAGRARGAASTGETGGRGLESVCRGRGRGGVAIATSVAER